MTDVNRIKRTKEKPDFHFVFLTRANFESKSDISVTQKFSELSCFENQMAAVMLRNEASLKFNWEFPPSSEWQIPSLQ